MIIIDSNIWIFSENENSEEHKLAAGKIKQIFDTDTFGINVIISSEVYHILSKFLGIKEARSRVADILGHPLVQWLDFTNDAVLGSLKLAETNRMRINDALIAYQALKANASLLTDNIKDFDKVKGLRLLPLR